MQAWSLLKIKMVLSGSEHEDFLDTVDIIYITGTFKGNQCLYLAYSSGDIHSAMFKDKKAALKYRKYDFSKITNPLN